jgi:hypothetical protein
VLAKLQDHRLFVKRSKCAFDERSVAYLGHVISIDGVAMDAQKVRAVLDWPVPRSARVVQAFLGLVGYYRRFVQGYSYVAALLTRLLRKEGFQWSMEAEEVFCTLQQALTSALVLHLPDFDKDFVVECDASGTGVGGVLHQGSELIAFFSHQLAPRHAKLTA